MQFLDALPSSFFLLFISSLFFFSPSCCSLCLRCLSISAARDFYRTGGARPRRRCSPRRAEVLSCEIVSHLNKGPRETPPQNQSQALGAWLQHFVPFNPEPAAVLPGGSRTSTSQLLFLNLTPLRPSVSFSAPISHRVGNAGNAERPQISASLPSCSDLHHLTSCCVASKKNLGSLDPPTGVRR